LFRSELKRRDLALHLRTQQKIGVPYTDEMVENAIMDAYGQAMPDTDAADGVLERYGETTNVRTFDGDPTKVTELDALIAYLQILGRLTDVAHQNPVLKMEDSE